MPSKKEMVLQALFDGLSAAVPAADWNRNKAAPEEIGAGGWCNLMDGDPGPPDVTLGVLSYAYDHEAELTVIVEAMDDAARDVALDALLVPIGAYLKANPTLGGVVDYVEPEAAEAFTDYDGGVVPRKFAPLPIILSYETSEPLN